MHEVMPVFSNDLQFRAFVFIDISPNPDLEHYHGKAVALDPDNPVPWSIFDLWKGFLPLVH